jgi:hypothetical protein
VGYPFDGQSRLADRLVGGVRHPLRSRLRTAANLTLDARIAENSAPIVDQSALDIRTTKIDTDKIGWFCARQWVDFSLGHESQRTKMVASTGQFGRE